MRCTYTLGLDSCQIFFVDTFHGPELVPIQRKTNNGQIIELMVPKAIEDYGDKMGAADASDQVRNGNFSFVMKHSGKKYTNRIFTGLDEFAETNAYNIYRHHHKLLSNDHGFHLKFKCNLVRGILEYTSENGRNRSAVNEIVSHERNHRQCIEYCPACEVSLHATCFAAYHAEIPSTTLLLSLL